jgi:iodotyrosine deiodinase
MTAGAASRFVSLGFPQEYTTVEVMERATGFREEMQRRRSVRAFSDRPVPREVIEECLLAAASAPSGANLQPWHFVVVGDPAIKRAIRLAAEREEHEFYHGRAPLEWLEVLAPLGTDEHKPYLEVAPYLIAVFGQTFRIRTDAGRTEGRRLKNYYVSESVGIATGILITALHHAGLAVLTHTPSPMGFLREILGRPQNERPYLLLVVGHPAADAVVPDIAKKRFEEVVTFL